MQKTKHTYLVSVEVDDLDGKTEQHSYHMPRNASIEDVFDTSLNMADFIMKTILEHEQQED